MFDMSCKEKEKDFELKIAKAKEKAEKQPTLMEIYTRLNKLELENKILKANDYELKKENLQLRNDNELLHNKLEIGSYDKTLFERESSDENNGYSEDELVNAYAMADKDFKIV